MLKEVGIDSKKTKIQIVTLLATEVSKTTPLKDKLNNILFLLDEHFGLKHTMLLIPNVEKNCLTVYASRGFPKEGIGARIAFGEGIIGMVAERRKKLRLANISRSRRYVSVITGEDNIPPPLPGLQNVESQIAIPLLADEELIAVLSAESTDVNFFSIDDEEFLMTLSQIMALSIQNAQILSGLENKVLERTAEIDLQKQELEEINKSKDKLFSIIAHDLRSPAASLQQVSALLKYYIEKDDRAKILDTGEKIAHIAYVLSQLLENLLSWSIKQIGALTLSSKPVNISIMMEEMMKMYESIASLKEIKIKLKCNNPYLWINGDQNSLYSIFHNLIYNAIKYTPPGGTISISAEKIAEDVEIKILDTGVGIAAEKIPHLFVLKEGKSTQGTFNEKGVGLGLILVKELVEANQGKIQIRSSKGKGTCVKTIFSFLHV